MIYFVFILLGITELLKSVLDVFHQFWKILVISSIIVSALFSFSSPSGIPVTHMLDLSLLSCVSPQLFSIFFICASVI